MGDNAAGQGGLAAQAAGGPGAPGQPGQIGGGVGSRSVAIFAVQGSELIIVDPLTPANRGTLMDHSLDLEVSKADSGVNKVV